MFGGQRRVVLSDGCKGLGFAFTKPSNCCIGYGLIRPDGIASFAHAKAAIPSRRGLSGGAGWPGRGSDFKANSIFQPPQDFQEALKRGHLHRCLFVGTWLHQTDRLIRADRPGQPEPPGSTRCSMPSTSQTRQPWTF